MEKEDYINSINLNIDTDFPYLVLDVIGKNSYPRNPGFQVMHWHEDLQFFSEEITLSDLSASANISKSECSRCFKISLNTTPYKYLTEYRLSKAAQLLAKTNEPVGNIAAAVGFHQISHFGKCFKEKTGCSPKAYREMENSHKQ